MSVTVYILKIRIKSESGIWRRIAVRADQTLVDLHHGICNSFGYECDENVGYVFSLPPEGRSGTARKWLSILYTSPEIYHHFEEMPFKILNAERFTFEQLRLKSRYKFEYECGRDNPELWRQHLISVEKDDAGNIADSYPAELEGRGVPLSL